MAKKLTKERDAMNKRFQNRIKGFAVLFTLGYGGLGGRLVYLQGLHPTKPALPQMQTIPPVRGDIFDVNNEPLAQSEYRGALYYDFHPAEGLPNDSKQVKENLQKRLQRSVAFVSQVLGVSEKTIHGKIAKAKQNPNDYKFLVMNNIPWAQTEKLLRPRDTMKSKVAQNFNLIGFKIEEKRDRIYHCKESAGYLVGALGPYGPMLGLELGANNWLQGEPGYTVGGANADSDPFDSQKEYSPPQNGKNVYTTIDAFAQTVAAQAARTTREANNAASVSIVIVRPKTGDIVALANAPSFPLDSEKMRELARLQRQYEEKKEEIKPFRDLRKQGDLSDADEKKYSGLKAELERLSEKHQDYEAMVTDRCIADPHDPGSTIKTLTIAGALQLGVINLNSSFHCDGTLGLGRRDRVTCPKHGGSNKHGTLNPLGILEHSCNVCAAQIGLEICRKHGKGALEKVMRDFGLFDSLELPLTWKNAYSNQQGVYNSVEPERAYLPAKTARVAFGHSMTASPVHVAMAYAALLNDGVLMKPRLIRETRTPDNKILETFAPKSVRQVVSAEVAAQVREMMQAVVVSGTGKKAALSGYQAGGKTGTAQQVIDRREIYVSSFVGYLPASKPKVVILVSVNDPNSARHFGGDIAAPVFREVAQRLMQHWSVPEDATRTVVAPNNLRPTPRPASRIRAKAR